MATSRRLTILETLRQMNARLDQQAAEVTNLNAALAIQLTRIAQMQAELDVLPTAVRRRQTLMMRMPLPSAHNGNGHEPVKR